MCCCCCLTGCQQDWKKAHWVCLEGCWRMDNRFSGGRMTLKWPFNYKGTTPVHKTRSGPLPGSGPILQPFCYGQMPATSALAAPSRDHHWLCWPVLGQGKRSSSPLQPHSQLGACAGCPRAGQASGRSTVPLSCSSLCISHKTGSCIPMVLLLPVLQGTGTKHSAGTEKHCIQMNLS